MLTVVKGPHLVSGVTLTFRVRGGESPVIHAGPEGVTFLCKGPHGDWLSSYFWYESLTVHVSPQEKEREHMSGLPIRRLPHVAMRVCYSSQPIGSGVKWVTLFQLIRRSLHGTSSINESLWVFSTNRSRGEVGLNKAKPIRNIVCDNSTNRSSVFLAPLAI